MNMLFERKLALPMEVKELNPLTMEMDKTVEAKRNEIKAVFEDRSDKLLLIIGPCSADNEDSVIDYVTRLRNVQEKVKYVFVNTSKLIFRQVLAVNKF